MTYVKQYVEEAVLILQRLDQSAVERTGDLLVELRERSGRLFLLGVGGGAGHASHAVCDFRKIALIEAYAPSDNVSELTARVNDEGWDTCYANWLRGSRLNKADMVLVFSSVAVTRRRTSARTWCGLWNTQARCAPRFVASLAATEATLRRSPTSVCLFLS